MFAFPQLSYQPKNLGFIVGFNKTFETTYLSKEEIMADIGTFTDIRNL